MRHTCNKHARRVQAASGIAVMLLCGAGMTTRAATPKVRAGSVPPARPAPPAPLAYRFTPGSVTHYKVAAFFDGHFPPFAQPDSPPVHFKADLGYTATVKKVDKEGAVVDFVVDSRELYLFKREMGESEKIDLNSEDVALMSGLTSLEDMQKALNATAILRPDGSIVRILSKSSVKIPFDVGFDIRKLFLMMLPVTFPDRAIKPGDAWPASDGLLGAKPGKTVYQDRLDSAAASGANATYRLSQKAHADVEDKLDKAGNSTAQDADVYRTLSGKVDLTSEMTFAVPDDTPRPAPKTAPGKAPRVITQAVPVPAAEIANSPRSGQVQSAHLVMNAVIVRTRVKINPDQPEIPEIDPLDVKARLIVTRAPVDKMAVKPAEKKAAKPAENKAAARDNAPAAPKAK